ncbi:MULTISPECIES: hypothetical protein [unclassified Pseudoalteromonas]|jgi:hypothetical protein|uniref:hypothetical protein n=1 Tax=unclassified Pseudoalteromonas TaxID=194690 RepID=UPI002358DDDC|nr:MULTISPECIES: hypothetical protein [unclassified Pseudoalteromonas]MDC9501411.1 hypothetical protein [Pseudoalteromonas sp. Angola-18]MDC9528224.1 hypothetical protein [Pseudoalteromonas sp. Angola-7]
MSDIKAYLTDSFTQFLDIIGKNSPYDKDAALAMVFILMERKVFIKKQRRILSLDLIEQCLNNKSMFENIIAQPSESTSSTYDYCYYPYTTKYLAKYGALNLSTLKYILTVLDKEFFAAQGSSSMNMSVHNIQGKAESAIVINDCIKLIQGYSNAKS